MRRLAGIAIALVCALALGGCAMTQESRLDEYKQAGEELMTQVIDLIPAELEPVLDGEMRSEGRVPQDGVTADRGPGDTAWWQVSADVTVVDRERAAEDAVAAVTPALEADGWTSSRVRETGGGREVTEGFRRDGWYIEIVWTRTEAGKVEYLEIVVVSPDTVRGDHDEIHS